MCQKATHSRSFYDYMDEYMFLAAAVQEALWLRNLAKDLDPNIVKKPTKIYMDNKGAIDLAHTTRYKVRTKHIDIKFHFIREQIEKSEVEICYIPTENMVADSLTKPLFTPKHNFCTRGMGLKDVKKGSISNSGEVLVDTEFETRSDIY